MKNGALDWWHAQILRKRAKTTSKIKQQQQQKLITSKTSCSLKKQNIITKSKKRQIKLILNKITLNLPEKIWDYSIKRLGNN